MCAYVLLYTGVEGVVGLKSQDGEDRNRGVERCRAIYYSY